MSCSISYPAFENFSFYLEWLFQQCSGSSNVAYFLFIFFLFAEQVGSSQCQDPKNHFQFLAGDFGVL